jgi:hypothetical protein
MKDSCSLVFLTFGLGCPSTWQVNCAVSPSTIDVLIGVLTIFAGFCCKLDVSDSRRTLAGRGPVGCFSIYLNASGWT